VHLFTSTTFSKGENSMSTTNQNYLLDALDTVLAWNLPDEALADALVNQAILMSGVDSEDSIHYFAESLH
jgi:hypothetical protein